MNFKQDFLDDLKEVEKYDHSFKLTIKEVIAAYPEIVKFPAMPSTQVSVERLFTALKIIKSDLRASIKVDLAEAILFLRTSYQ